MRAIRLLLVFAFGTAGCLDIHPPDQAWKCGANHACPTGYSCDTAINACIANDHTFPAVDMSMKPTGKTGLTPSETSSTLTMSSMGPLVANGVSQAKLVVTVLDAGKNPVPNVSVSFLDMDVRDHFSPPSGTSDQAGTVSSAMTAETGGNKSVLAHVVWTYGGGGTFDLPLSVAFASDPNSANSSIAVNNTRFAADGTASAQIIITVKDGNMMPVAGAPVTVGTLEVSGADPGGQNHLAVDHAMTDGNGQLHATLTSTFAGDKSITADVTVAQETFRLTKTISFDPIPDAGKSTITVPAGQIFADGSAGGLVTVTVSDRNSALVSGATVALSSDPGTMFNNFSGTVTNTSGVYSAKIVSTAGGAHGVTAAVSWNVDGSTGTFMLTSADQVQFTAVPSASKSTLQFVPNTPVLANNSTTVQANVTIVDFSGTPMAGVAVTMTSASSGVSIATPIPNTSNNGTTSTSFQATTPGKKTLNVIVNGQQLLSGDYTFAAVSVAKVTFGGSITASGHNIQPFNVTAFDAVNAPLTTISAPITVKLTDSLGNPQGVLGGNGATSVMTNASGVAAFSNLTAAPANNAACSAQTNNCTFYLTVTTPGANGTVQAISSKFTVSDDKLTTPTITNVAHRSDRPSSIDVNWSSVGTGINYWVLRSTTQNGTFNPVTTAPINCTTYTDSNLMHGNYYYEVLATTKTSWSDANGTNSDPQTPVGDEAWREICVANYHAATSGVVVLPAESNSGLASTSPPLRGIQSDESPVFRPSSVATDLTSANPRIFIADYISPNAGSGSNDAPLITAWSRTANTIGSSSQQTPLTSISVKHPTGDTSTQASYATLVSIAWDPRDNEVIVVDQTGGAILAYNLNSPSTYAWSMYGSNIAGPLAVAVNQLASDVEIYVTRNTGSAQMIDVFSRNAIASAAASAANHDVTTVKPVRTIGDYFDGTHYAIDTPYGLFNDGTNLWVANGNSPGSISRFKLSDGDNVGSTVKPGLQFFYASFNRPESVAVDPDTGGGHVFVVNNGGVVNVFDLTGAHQGDIQSNPALVSPEGIAFCN